MTDHPSPASRVVTAWDASNDAWESGKTASPSTNDRWQDAAEVLGRDPSIDVDTLYDLECAGIPVELIAQIVAGEVSMADAAPIIAVRGIKCR